LAANKDAVPQPSPAAVGALITGNAVAGILTGVGAGSPNLMLFSLVSGTPQEPPVQNIAVRQPLSGVAVKSGKNWRAKITVTMHDLANYQPVASVTVQGSFAPAGGTGSCVTTSTGTCTITSSTISSSVAATQFTVTGASGNNMAYDAQTGGGSVIVNRP
jgi:hypothetical protein